MALAPGKLGAQTATYQLDNASISSKLNASDTTEPHDNWFANEFTALAGANVITRVDFGVFTTTSNSTASVVLYRVTDPGGDPALGATRVYTQSFAPLTGDGTNAFLQPINLTSPVTFNVGDRFLVAVFISNVIAAPPNDVYPYLLDTSGIATGTYWDRSAPNTFNLDDLSQAKPINQAFVAGGFVPGAGHIIIRAWGGAPIADLYHTGINPTGTGLQPLGSADAHWTLATPYPTSASGQPVPLPSTLSFGPAFVNSPDGAWLADGPNSQWITPTNVSNPGGNYIYQTTFHIPSGYDPTTASITGWWSSDNEGIAAWLNDSPLAGFPLPGPASFNAMTSFTISNGVAGATFQPGLNKLSFQVRNRGGGGIDANSTDTGIRVEFTNSVVQWTNGATAQPTALPVYIVVQSGATLGQAQALANGLGIPTASLVYSNGAVSFIDPTNWMRVPTLPVTDPVLISNLLAVTKNPDPSIPINFEAIDFGSLTNQSPPGSNFVLTSVSTALSSAGLTPQFGTPVLGGTLFTAFCTNDDGSVTSAHVPLDTQVNYQFTDNNGIPIIGPGAQARVAYGLNGQVTYLLYTAPRLVAGPQVQLISSNTAIGRVTNLVPPNAQISANLVYLVYHWWPPPPCYPPWCPGPTPPWGMPDPTNVIPWYSFTVTSTLTNAVSGSNYLSRLTLPNIPATDDPTYVPAAVLSASGTTQVVAAVSASGGTPPYRYYWSGSNPEVATNSGPDITYTPTIRVAQPMLLVEYTDRTHLPTNSIVLAWPAPATGFILESASGLPAAAWSQVSYPVTTNADGLYTVTVPATANRQFFRLRLTQPAPMAETVSVTVMDANGVTAQSSQTLTVQPTALPVAADVDPPATWGTESPYDANGFDQDTAGWRGVMANPGCGGGAQLFCWTKYSSWPGDFMEPTPKNTLQAIAPLDPPAPSIYADADFLNWGVNGANMTLYEGHGNCTAFTFTYPDFVQVGVRPAYGLMLNAPGVGMGAEYYDGHSYNLDLSRSWGNDGPNDYLNWLSLFSCEVLMYNANNPNDAAAPHAGGLYAWQRWGGAFNGLHIMLGYHTECFYPCGTPALFANNMLGCNGQGAQNIVSAWFNASHASQSGNGIVVRPAAMGPIGQRFVWDFNDWYPGKGAMGPSLLPRLGQIRGWWYLW